MVKLRLSVALLLVVALGAFSGVHAAQPKGKKAKAAGPKKMSVADAEAAVAHLAGDVFDRNVKGKNTHLGKTEFHKSKDSIHSQLMAWVQSGKLRQIRESGWKWTQAAAPAASSAKSGGATDIAKIEKALKVEKPEFTDYTRYAVDKAMHDLPNGKQHAKAPPAVKRGHKPPAAHPNNAAKKAIQAEQKKRAAMVRNVKARKDDAKK